MDEKIKIVMVDDEQDLCVLVKDNLEDTGEFVVITVSNAEKAEDMIKREQPDLILMDVVMPGMKGDEIVKRLSKDEQTKNIPVIMVSGKGEMVYNKKKGTFKWMPNTKVIAERGDLPSLKGSEALAAAYGAKDYVSKPFSTGLLIDVIHDVMKQTKKQTVEQEEPPPV